MNNPTPNRSLELHSYMELSPYLYIRAHVREEGPEKAHFRSPLKKS